MKLYLLLFKLFSANEQTLFWQRRGIQSPTFHCLQQNKSRCRHSLSGPRAVKVAVLASQRPKLTPKKEICSRAAWVSRKANSREKDKVEKTALRRDWANVFNSQACLSWNENALTLGGERLRRSFYVGHIASLIKIITPAPAVLRNI